MTNANHILRNILKQANRPAVRLASRIGALRENRADGGTTGTAPSISGRRRARELSSASPVLNLC